VAEGHGGGGGLRAKSNHPALAAASAAPPYPRRGLFSVHRLLMSLCIALNGVHWCRHLWRSGSSLSPICLEEGMDGCLVGPQPLGMQGRPFEIWLISAGRRDP
jgi:hypothetical protein